MWASPCAGSLKVALSVRRVRLVVCAIIVATKHLLPRLAADAPRAPLPEVATRMSAKEQYDYGCENKFSTVVWCGVVRDCMPPWSELVSLSSKKPRCPFPQMCLLSPPSRKLINKVGQRIISGPISLSFNVTAPTYDNHLGSVYVDGERASVEYDMICHVFGPPLALQSIDPWRESKHELFFSTRVLYARQSGVHVCVPRCIDAFEGLGVIVAYPIRKCVRTSWINRQAEINFEFCQC